jgi:hypothetical protein
MLFSAETFQWLVDAVRKFGSIACTVVPAGRPAAYVSVNGALGRGEKMFTPKTYAGRGFD